MNHPVTRLSLSMLFAAALLPLLATSASAQEAHPATWQQPAVSREAAAPAGLSRAQVRNELARVRALGGFAPDENLNPLQADEQLARLNARPQAAPVYAGRR